MTAQISDIFVLDGLEYQILGVGDSLVDPDDFGIKPVMMHTACYRGFHSTFLLDGCIRLTRMIVRNSSGVYPDIDGISPSVETASKIATYDGLAHPIRYSGRLALGKDFLPERYVHMGYPPETSFRRVLHLTCENGEVKEVADVSEQVALRRENIGKEAQTSPSAARRRMLDVEVEVVPYKKDR